MLVPTCVVVSVGGGWVACVRGNDNDNDNEDVFIVTGIEYRVSTISYYINYNNPQNIIAQEYTKMYSISAITIH